MSFHMPPAGFYGAETGFLKDDMKYFWGSGQGTGWTQLVLNRVVDGDNIHVTLCASNDDPDLNIRWGSGSTTGIVRRRRFIQPDSNMLWEVYHCVVPAGESTAGQVTLEMQGTGTGGGSATDMGMLCLQPRTLVPQGVRFVPTSFNRSNQVGPPGTIDNMVNGADVGIVQITNIDNLSSTNGSSDLTNVQKLFTTSGGRQFIYQWDFVIGDGGPYNPNGFGIGAVDWWGCGTDYMT